jgi:hypothetical protein
MANTTFEFFGDGKTILDKDKLAKNEPARAIPIGQAPTTDPMSEPTKSSTPSTSKLLGAYNQNLILVVLAVAGYFAYKKFKK